MDLFMETGRYEGLKIYLSNDIQSYPRDLYIHVYIPELSRYVINFISDM